MSVELGRQVLFLRCGEASEFRIVTFKHATTESISAGTTVSCCTGAGGAGNGCVHGWQAHECESRLDHVDLPTFSPHLSPSLNTNSTVLKLIHYSLRAHTGARRLQNHRNQHVAEACYPFVNPSGHHDIHHSSLQPQRHQRQQQRQTVLRRRSSGRERQGITGRGLQGIFRRDHDERALSGLLYSLLVPPMQDHLPCVCHVEWKACGREIFKSRCE